MDIENKIFGLAVITSFLTHIAAFAGLMYVQWQNPRRSAKQFEVVYQSAAVTVKDPPSVSQHRSEGPKIQEQKLIPSPRIISRQVSGPGGLVPDAARDPLKLMAEKKQVRVGSSEAKRQVSIPVLQAEKAMGPKYLNYRDRIREKIKERAYFYTDHPRFESGEVYLTFVLSSDGTLSDLKVISERSRANDYLKDAGLRSIRESNPFPPFPADLNYPELTFNLLISFEIGE